MIPTEKLLAFCAAKYNPRHYWMIGPWRNGRSIYATDGAVIVSVPDDGRTLTEPEGRVVSDRMINDALAFDGNCRRKWPEVVGKWRRCIACACTFCRGTGRCVCTCGHDHMCFPCDGKGCTEEAVAKCHTCRGAGLVYEPQTIAGRLIDGNLAWLIDSLGDVRYGRDGKPDSPLHFRLAAESLVGVVMPMVHDSTVKP